MGYIAKDTDYWIHSSALTFTLNALNVANYIQCTVAGGAVIQCFIPDADEVGTLGYSASHGYKSWKLQAGPTAFNNDAAKYVYVAIPKDKDANTAMVVYPSEKLDINGQNEAGQQIGNTNYYYIWLQGVISAVQGTRRSWNPEISTGKLDTAAGDAERSQSSIWYEYSAVADAVTLLKRLSMAATSWFTNIRLGSDKHNLTGVATAVTADEFMDSDELVATPSYINANYLSKKNDDTVEGNITFQKDISVSGNAFVNGILTVGNWLKAKWAELAYIKSPDYTGDGAGDTGFLLTNDYNGHSRLTVDELYVRMKAIFEELQVKKETVIGGNQIFSCASNIISFTRFIHVEEIGGEITETDVSFHRVKMPVKVKGLPAFISRLLQNTKIVSNILSKSEIRRKTYTDETEFNAAVQRVRCYFLAKEGENEIENWWVGDSTNGHDLAKCQTFNLTNKYRESYVNFGGNQSPNVYWWRKVVGVSSSPVEIEGKMYHWFDVAVSTDDCAQGSDIPAAGDHVSQFGNDTDPERMNLISIEINGSEAPSIKLYEGIDRFLITDGRYGNPMKARLSPKAGYRFSGSKFEIVTDYAIEPATIERGNWLDIPVTDGVRICYYYDLVQHNGATWKCVASYQGSYQVDEAFTYDGHNYAVNDIIEQTTYNTLPVEQRQKCHRVKKGYTTDEPSETSPSWVIYAAKGEKGDKGTSIKTVVTKYAKQTTVQYTGTPPTAGWQDSITALGTINDGDYLWIKTTTTYSDTLADSTVYSVSRWGIDGDGIANIETKFYEDDDLLSQADLEALAENSWKDTYSQLALNKGDYIYTRTKITYDKGGTPTVSYSVNRIGEDGVSYVTTEEYYCLGSSNTTPPDHNPYTRNDGKPESMTPATMASRMSGGDWSESRPNYDTSTAASRAKKYLWNFEVCYDTTTNVQVTQPICIANYEKGIQSIVETYTVSTHTTKAAMLADTDERTAHPWVDEVQNSAPDDDSPYQWNKTVTTYTDGSSDTFYHISAVKGTPGRNSIRLALDNEHEDFLYSDSQVLPIAPNGGATSAIHLYSGANELTSGFTLAVDFTKSRGVPGNSDANKPTISNGVLTVPHITAETAKVVVKATYPSTDGEDYYAEFTANKTSQDKYDLKLTPNAIAFNLSEAWTNKTITPSAERTDLQGNKTTGLTIQTTAVNGLRLYYSYVKTDGTLLDPSLNLLTTATFSLTENNAKTYIGVYFELRLYTGSSYRMCDYETVEIAKTANGASGSNGDTPIQLFKWSQTPLTASDKPTVTAAQWAQPDPYSGWYKQAQNRPSGDGYILYMSQNTLEGDGTIDSAAWSTPVQISGTDGTPGEDGTDIEYIYILKTSQYTFPNNEKPANITTDTSGTQRTAEYIASHDDFVPYGWNDNPQGIDSTNKFEYMSFRVKAKGSSTWGAFSEPIIWSHFGRNGMDGDGTEYVFIRTKNFIAPVMDSTQTGYESDDFRPAITAASQTASDTEQAQTTDDPKGTNDTYKYEWVAKRNMTAPNSTTGERTWKKYTGENNNYEMTLWSTYAESNLIIDIDNEADQFGTDSDGVVIPAPQVRTTEVSLFYGTTAQVLNADDAQTPGVAAALFYENGTAVPNTRAEVSCHRNTTDTTKGEVEVTVKSGTFPSAHTGIYALITATCAKGSRSRSFTLQQVKSGASGVAPDLCNLRPTVSSINFSKAEQQDIVRKPLGCGYTLVTPSGTTNESVASSVVVNGTTFYIYWRYVGGTYARFTTASAIYASGILPSTSRTGVEFCLSSALIASSITDANTLDYEKVPILKDGTDGTNGENAIRLDLDNEYDSIQYQGDGVTKVDSSATVQTRVYLFDGAIDQSAAASFTISDRSGMSDQQATISGRVVTVNGLVSDGEVTVRAEYPANSGKYYYAKFTVKKIIGIDKFDLVVSPNAVGINTSGTVADTSIGVQVYRTPANGGTRHLVEWTKVNGVYTSDYRLTLSVTEDHQSSSLQESTSADPATSRYFKLTSMQALSANNVAVVLTKDGKTQDSETVPITRVQDGAPGSGANAVRIDLDNEMDSIPTDSDGKVLSQVVLSTIARIYDGAAPVSSGVAVSSVDAIAGVNATTSVNAGVVTIQWTIPATGSGTPLSVDKYVSQIELTWNSNSYHATFVAAVIKSGEPGVSPEILRLLPSPSKVAFAANSSGVIPSSSQTLSLSIKRTVGNSTTIISIAQSGLTVRYGISSMPAVVSDGNAWPAAGLTVRSTATYGNVYIAAFDGNNLVDKETVPIIKDGEKGDKGDKGDEGEQGERGKMGRFFYYAQEWHIPQAGEDNPSYVVNDAQAPFFSYGGGYYVFNPEEPTQSSYTMQQMGEPDIDDPDSGWQLMTNQFKYIITEALFANFAHLGSFIINGDWLFSQYGMWGNNSTPKDEENGHTVTYWNVAGGQGNVEETAEAYTTINLEYPERTYEQIIEDNETKVGTEIVYDPRALYHYQFNWEKYLVYSIRCKCDGNCRLYLRDMSSNTDYALPMVRTYDSPDTYIWSLYIKVRNTGNYRIVAKHVDQTAADTRVQVDWMELYERSFRPNYAVDGKTGKTVQWKLYGNLTGEVSATRIGNSGNTVLNGQTYIEHLQINVGGDLKIPSRIDGMEILGSNGSAVKRGYLVLEEKTLGSGEYYFKFVQQYP